MTRKRRMFDIELPDDGLPETFRAGKDAPRRRGPMAAAISDVGESIHDRARLEAGIRPENDAFAQEHVRLKQVELITDLIPLDVIDTQHLIRNRASGPDFELAEWTASIRYIGLSNPSRVEQATYGRLEICLPRDFFNAGTAAA